MISPAQAEDAIRAHVAPLPAVTVPLAQLTGLTLREPISAALDQPPFDRVMMDGIALSFAACEQGRRSFRVAGTQAAGAAPLSLAAQDQCIEVMTGAMLPHGCDCVIPVERIEVRDGIAQLAPDAMPARGLNIHPRGMDSRRGSPLLDPGTVLGPAQIAVLASHGRTHAIVSPSPRIMVISTGDELVEPGEPLSPWQIYRSNVYSVLSVLQRRGLTRLVQDHLPDDPAILRTKLEAHLSAHDVLILSGGVSMGRFDYVPQVLAELGVKVVFHKVAQRPGKPLWFGIGAGGRTVYALPGNPVSTLVCLVRYVLPGLAAAQGAVPRPQQCIALGADFPARTALTQFVPARIAFDQGRRVAQLQPTQGSGDFTSLLGTDGFVELPPGPQVLPGGTPVPLYCW
jgi:molybdopterin molybdotransferase